MRWIFRVFFVLVIVGIAAGAFLIWLPADTIARLAAERFTAATGRNLIIAGDVSATVWPTLGVTADDVTLANREDGDAENLLKADRIYIGINPLTIFSETIQVRSIELVNPVINLERADDGTANWVFSGDGSSTAGPDLAVDKISVRHGQVRYSERGKLELEATEASGDLWLSKGSAELEFAARYNGQAVDGTFAAENVAQLVVGQTQVDAKVNVGTSALTFNGAFNLAEMSASGPVRFELTDRAAAFGVLGIATPDLPLGLGRDRLAVIANLDLADHRASLTNMSLDLDQNHFTGSAVIDFANRPLIDANLSASIIDLSALPKDSTTTSSWSKEPLAVSVFSQFDTSLTLAFNKGTIGTFELGDTAMRVVLNGGEAEAEISKMALFEGQVVGTANADFRQGVALSAQLVAKDVSTKDVGVELIGTDRLLARADGNANLTARGNSIAELMASLDGDGDFSLSSGELRGVDLATMLRTLDPAGQTESSRTIFDGATASFTIQDGVLNNKDLAVTAPILLGNGEGQIGINARDIDYSFVAQLPENVIGQVVKLPIEISGSWSDPHFRLDMADLVSAKYGVNLDSLGEAAIDDLREKISADLGIDIAPDVDLKRALSEGLEKKALDSISKGFAGIGEESSAPAVEPASPLTQTPESIEPDTKSETASPAPASSPVPKLRPAATAPTAPTEPVPTSPTPVLDLPADETPTTEAPVEQPVTEATSEPTTAVEEPPIAVEAPAPEEPAIADTPEPAEPVVLPCPAEISSETALPCTLPDGTLFSG